VVWKHAVDGPTLRIQAGREGGGNAWRARAKEAADVQQNLLFGMNAA
jgi:hypothetical protein